MQQSKAELRVGVVIASIGRPAELGLLLRRLARQTLAPSIIVLSITRPEDLPAESLDSVQSVMGAAGLPAQRNRGMEIALPCSDIIAFFDDDYVPSLRAVEGVAALFAEHPDIVGANGALLADGVRSGGINAAEAERMVDAFDAGAPPKAVITLNPDGLYGCNMAYRSSAIDDARFDEALPLYGWQEDIDFSVLIGRRGRLVKSTAFTGVHCGVTKSRASGLRLGYSQIANPVYLVRKGTMRFGFAADLMLRNLVANHLKCFWPEPWLDRKGRLIGNWLALRDLLLGRLHPNKILELNR